MIYCVRFSDFERYLETEGFARARETEGDFVYVRDHEFVTVRKPNAQGDLTQQEIDKVCDAADLHPPTFVTHWCD